MTSADPLLVVSFLFLATVVWLIARAWRQNGVLLRVAPEPAPAGSTLPPLTVVVPARDEFNRTTSTSSVATASLMTTCSPLAYRKRNWRSRLIREP